MKVSWHACYRRSLGCIAHGRPKKSHSESAIILLLWRGFSGLGWLSSERSCRILALVEAPEIEAESDLPSYRNPVCNPRKHLKLFTDPISAS